MPIYCPRCGQQQLSSDVRFCSRCGLQLEGVEDLVATGGLSLVPERAPGQLSPRQRGIRLGAKALFAGVVLVPVALGLSILFDSPAPLLLFVTIVLVGFARMAYARLFEDDAPAAGARRQGALAARDAGGLPPYLPPTPAGPPRRLTTGELEAPPSVTEHTTNLLDKSR
jgi:hypothetical protein